MLVDRAEGAASLQDGAVEVMLHRRILYSCFGFNLNETGVDGRGLIITGTHRLFLSSAKEDAFVTRMRLQQQRAYAPLYPVFASATGSSLAVAEVTSAVKKDLPPNVEVMTLQQLNATTTLLRLSHSFAVNESSVWSTPVSVDLSTLFSKRIVALQEMSLTGNARMQSTSEEVTLKPMEIRTFFITLAK